MDELSTSKSVSSVGLQVGYKQLKHEQNETVKELVIGRDVFVSLPMCSGKSLCYAVLPAAVNVRSPLQYYPSASLCGRWYLAHSQG